LRRFAVSVRADAADAKVLAVCLAGFRRRFIGSAQLRAFEFAGNAQGGAEIIGADQQHIDSRHSGDGIGIDDTFRCFQHGNENSCGVALLVDVGKWCCVVALQRPGATDRALTQRRKPAGAHECFGLGARADARADNAEGAHVEQARRILEPVAGDAHQRRHADRERCNTYLCRRVE
jgi:hypothetical protein